MLNGQKFQPKVFEILGGRVFHHRPLVDPVMIGVGGGTPPSRVLRDYLYGFENKESNGNLEPRTSRSTTERTSAAKPQPKQSGSGRSSLRSLRSLRLNQEKESAAENAKIAERGRKTGDQSTNHPHHTHSMGLWIYQHSTPR